MIHRKEVYPFISGLIKNGINFDDKETYECNNFMSQLSDFINRHTHLNSHHKGNKILIESVFFDPLLSVEIEKKIIQCIPITDDGWIEAVFEVIRFIYINDREKENEKMEKLRKQQEDDKQFDWI
jgi:hypothetical protein